jgi:long-chain acyl-CoA synthetase
MNPEFMLPLNPIFAFLFKTWAKLFFFLSVKGIENLPKEGPLIICPNHASYIDGPMLAASLPMETLFNTYFLGNRAFFQHLLLRWANKLVRLVPIDPALRTPESLQACSYILRNGKFLCIFPEGLRSLDGEVKGYKRGVGVLIKELNVPVLPVYINGSYEAWPPHRKLPRLCKVSIVFGRRILPHQLISGCKEGIDIYQCISKGFKI